MRDPDPMRGNAHETLPALAPASDPSIPHAQDDTLEGLVDSAAATRRQPTPMLARGESVGRYVVLGRVGSGGMGVVYAAYDPDLDRKVALKVLHASVPGSAGSGGEARLLREAQAMAKLAHPNVIAVHDVGTFRGQVFVAMEFVDGPTLAHWQKKTHDWREVVRVYIQAGRGLAAAHAAGIVHRDFKPHNALLGGDGRVRVVDFGLARRLGTHDSTAGQSAIATSSQLQADLTATGAVLGTPAYMAPEQHLGREPGPESDQFSFCVALYEALYHQRAFAGDHVANLALEVLEGRVREPPRRRGVPLRLFRILAQGLRVSPQSRYPSMDALLDDLAHDPSARRRRWTLGIVATAAAITPAWLAWSKGAAPAPCDGGEDRVAAIWNDARRDSIATAFARIDVAFAAEAWRRAADEIDRHAAAWVDMYTQTCRATHVLGEQSEHVLDLRMQCLGRRLTELDAFVAVLQEPDETTARKLGDAVHELAPLDACADIESLSARIAVPDDPQIRQRVEDLRQRVALVSSRGRIGQLDLALEEIATLVEEARAIAWPLLLAETLETYGALLSKRRRMAEAEAALEEAVWTAMRAGDDATAMRAALELSFFVGYEESRHADGERWHKLVEALLPRLPGEIRSRIRAHYARGATLFGRGRIDDAHAEFQAAQKIASDELPTDHPYFGMIATALGNIHLTQGRPSEALEHYRTALALMRASLGDDHPNLADQHVNLGNVYWMLDDYANARAEHERALHLLELLYGREHPDVALQIYNIGLIHEDEGRADEAEASFEQALTTMEATLGPEHLDVARPLLALGKLARRRGDHATALDHDRRALQIRQAALERDHPDLAHALSAVAQDAIAIGRHTDAERDLREALRIKEVALGADHPSVAHTLTVLGDTRHALGDTAEAIAMFERAIAIQEGTPDYDSNAREATRARLEELRAAVR